MNTIRLAEMGLVPDILIRTGIRRKLAAKVALEASRSGAQSIDDMVAELSESPIAVETDRANEQHYEIPSAYFLRCLGKHLKYSATIWPEGVTELDASELAMLRLTAERAELAPGQRVLELGCGWGSFSLWAAREYPESQFVAVSNSSSQREFIMEEVCKRGLDNLTVLTRDMNEFVPEGTFNRVVSIEMFEHMKNYRQLLRRIASWLRPGGKLFVHVFSHRKYTYHYLDEGAEKDWMAHYFFAGGIMPSDDLLLRFQEDLRVERHWRINGTHYSRTLEAWLKKHDAEKQAVLKIFEQCYGSPDAAKTWFNRWRLFYLACSELFRFRGGEEWMVSHYRFKKP